MSDIFLERKDVDGRERVTTDDVQSSSQIVTTTKPTPNFLQAGCPSCRPTNSVKYDLV